MLVYPHEKIPTKVAQNFPYGPDMGKSANGWMTADVFFDQIKSLFYPWVVDNGIEFPVLLYVDGHVSHITMEMSDFCVQHKIEWIALFLNATHILQPMDVAVFRALKASYRKAVESWRFDNCEQGLTKYHFATVLKSALDSMNIQDVLKSGFRACGLHPFNPDKVDYSKLFVKTNHPPSESQLQAISKNTTPSDVLAVVESYIDPVALKFFKCHNETEVWTHPVEFLELYNFWLKIKKAAENHFQDLNDSGRINQSPGSLQNFTNIVNQIPHMEVITIASDSSHCSGQ